MNTTRFTFTGYDGKKTDVIMRTIRGNHDGMYCRNVECCCTRWEIYTHHTNGVKELTFEIPLTIRFVIGEKLLTNPLHISPVVEKDKMIFMACDYGCDFTHRIECECRHGSDIKHYLTHVRDNIYTFDGFFSPEHLQVMLSIANNHGNEHSYGSREKFCSCIREFSNKVSDQYTDLSVRKNYSGDTIFQCEVGIKCQFPTCVERRKYGIANNTFTYSIAFKHHQSYVSKKYAEILASSTHHRLGKDSSCCSDPHILSRIISLLKN